MAAPVNPFQVHSRRFRDNRYVYPVISRRSRGLSLGINLNPEMDCNFHCVYCQVGQGATLGADNISNQIDLPVLEAELEHAARAITRGDIWQIPPFDHTPAGKKIWRDIAFSGDGEPTSSPWFLPAWERVAGLLKETNRDRAGENQVRPVLITNGTFLNSAKLKDFWPEFFALGGKAWVKLDAGNQEDFQRVAAVKMDFAKLLADLREFARQWPVTLQTCLFARDDRDYAWSADLPVTIDYADYTRQVADLLRAGGKIESVQLYTLARATKVKSLFSLTPEQLATAGERLRAGLAETGRPVPPVELFDSGAAPRAEEKD